MIKQNSKKRMNPVTIIVFEHQKGTHTKQYLDSLLQHDAKCVTI